MDWYSYKYRLIDLDLQEIRCAFCVQNAIVHVGVKKCTSSFIINGPLASRTQFPLRTAFTLTMHKIQG